MYYIFFSILLRQEYNWQTVFTDKASVYLCCSASGIQGFHTTPQYTTPVYSIEFILLPTGSTEQEVEVIPEDFIEQIHGRV